MESILNATIPFQFHTFILGMIKIKTEDTYLYNILITAAKKAITKRWLLPDPPSVEQWSDIVSEIYQMERLTFSLRLQMRTFLKLWSKWITYVSANPTHQLAILDIQDI